MLWIIPNKSFLLCTNTIILKGVPDYTFYLLYTNVCRIIPNTMFLLYTKMFRIIPNTVFLLYTNVFRIFLNTIFLLFSILFRIIPNSVVLLCTKVFRIIPNTICFYYAQKCSGLFQFFFAIIHKSVPDYS